MLVLSGSAAIFVGLIVLMSTRDLILSLISLGLTFIVVLVVLAMLVLAVAPTDDEKIDLDKQNHGH